MRKIQSSIGVMAMLLTGCMWSSSAQAKRIADNLQTMVHPIAEDSSGYRQAAKIRKCAAAKAEATCESERLDKFDEELAKYASEVREFEANFDLSSLLSDASHRYPNPSEYLLAELQDFAKFIAECEEKVGGRGVEF